MEIRRCDKCDLVLDHKNIKEVNYMEYVDQNTHAFRLTVPITKSANDVVKDQTGLDDRDEFGIGFTKRELDLCEGCTTALATTVTKWLAK